MNPATIPDTGYLRLKQIIGQKVVTPEQAEANRLNGKRPLTPKEGIPAIIPIAASTLWRKVEQGEFPQPKRLPGRITVWRVEDIREYLEQEGV